MGNTSLLFFQINLTQPPDLNSDPCVSLFPQHHCRHCGNIFCAECSARNALTPSSKKPVRVCDNCYDELQV